MKGLLWIAMTGLVAIGACGPGGAAETFRSPTSTTDRTRDREADDIALLLGLRADQRPALVAFLGDHMPPAPARPDVDRGPDWGRNPGADRGADPSEDFTDHLRRMEANSARRFEDAGRRTANARAFYATLDARQRTAFEVLTRLRRVPGGAGGGHGRPEGPPPGEGGAPFR